MNRAKGRPAADAPETGPSTLTSQAATKPPSRVPESSGIAGARQAAEAMDPWKRSTLMASIRHRAGSGRYFTVDDCWADGVIPPENPNAVGGVFLAALTAGIIRPVGYTSSKRGSRHGGVVRTWVGVDVK